VRTVDFYFGIGSRYSYLAATQISRLAAETGARFIWKPVYSRELIERAGSDPFRPEVRRGQYDPAYRTQDAKRWAAYYGVPYKEPAWDRIDWKKLALACVAADQLGAGEAYAIQLFGLCFGDGATRVDEANLGKIAVAVKLDAAGFAEVLASPSTTEQHDKSLAAAMNAGAFGVPTFVLDDGELFWGQDRLPLLRHRLMHK
jgi:2-hydroxychromene-2-carboxylate isomerase